MRTRDRGGLTGSIGLRGLWLIAVVGLGCGDSDASSGSSNVADASQADAAVPMLPEGGSGSPNAYDTDQVLEVSLELASDDWEQLRFEGRDTASVLSACGDRSFSYTWFEAEVTLQGQTCANVGIRKKGFLGSLSSTRPSLRLELDRFVEDQRCLALSHMTLNNNRQDSTHAQQCVSYQVFAEAGLPAPRCSIAHVTVNGEDLGFFSNVEPIKNRFLRRVFGSDEGNLYEGQGTDFTAGLISRIEKKNHEAEADFSDVNALTEALEADDDQLLAALAAHLDVDRFIRFWAVESLVGHWDGYTGNANNFMLYKDPKSGLFEFIPWGTDGTFSEHGFINDYPPSRYVTTVLPRRLYALPETRAAYKAEMRVLLDEVWDEERLLALVDKFSEQAQVAADHSRLARLRAFIVGRRAEIEADLSEGDDAWLAQSPFSPECRYETATFAVTFETAWGDLSVFRAAGGNSMDVDFSDAARPFESVSAAAGWLDDETTLGPVIRVLGVRSGEPFTVAHFAIPEAYLTPGRYPLHGFEVFGIVGWAMGTDQFDAKGILTSGELVLVEASMEAGAPVVGSFEGELVLLPEGLLDS